MSKQVLKVLERGMKTFPQLRLCQLIINAVDDRDIYYTSDEMLADYVEAYIKEHGGSNA